MNNYNEATKILSERFGKDTLIQIATIQNNRPFVRTVNAYYEYGMFYVITYALSGKMEHIKIHNEVAICGEWFTAHGIGENIGHICAEKNLKLTTKLQKAFAAWYNNGHIDENDPNTCILCIKLTDAVLFSNGTRYNIDFLNKSA